MTTLGDLRRETARNPAGPVGQVLTRDGHPAIALVDLGADASEKLRASWRGKRAPFESGGSLDSAWLLPILGAGGTAASSLAAGNVFLATANPATLMTIGPGVASAVMGPTGIIAQAPFVAASTALLPVVAPVMLFMTISSVMTCARLDRVQRTLDRLTVIVDRMRDLMEAEDHAKFDSAAEQLDEIGDELGHSLRFTDAMKIELVQARRDAGRLRLKYGRLANRANQSHDPWSTVSHIHLFALSTILTLRADLLRLHLTLQEDAHAAARFQTESRRRTKHRADELRALLGEHPIELLRGRLQKDRDGMGRIARALGRGRSLKEWIRAIDNIRDSEEFNRARSDMKRCVSELDAYAVATRRESLEADPETIVIYREEAPGGSLKAYRTRDLQLQQVAA